MKLYLCDDKNVFKYDYGEYDIFYSPIARTMVVAKKNEQTSDYTDAVRSLTDYVPIAQQRKVRTPEDYTLLTVLPNNTCNFSCSYCYSAAGRNHSVLPLHKLFVAIKYFISSKSKGFERPLTISFMGGGEPILSWNNVKEGICYAEHLAQEKGLELNVSVITNGSVINKEYTDFFLQHKVNISVSFEMLPEVQNIQRKNYDLVKNNIQMLCAAGIPVQINATITPLNVGRMQEMLKIAVRDFPQVRSLMFEPATGESIYGKVDILREFYRVYVTEFRECLLIADEFGLSLTSFAYLRTIFPLERACPAELCLTADGYITGCYCVGTPKESLFTQTKYGEVVDDHIEFDLNRFRQFISVNVYTKEECKNCIVKWNCGGGCFFQYKSYSSDFLEEVCEFTRNFIEMIVKYRVEKFCKQNKNISYPAIIKI